MIDSKQSLAINAFVADAVLFIVFCSRFLHSHLQVTYHYMGIRSFVSRFSEKLVRYPLFLHKSFETEISRMGFLYVYSDMAKLWRALGVIDGAKGCVFRDAPDFFLLLKEIYAKYF